MKGAAIVFGAGGGIGAALVAALRDEGDHAAVVGLARADCDILNEDELAAAASRIAAGPPPSLVVVATGLLHEGERGPEKSVRELDADWMARLYAVNAIGPALVAKHLLPLMPRGERAVLAFLSARVGSISDNRLGGWYGYRAAKAALNQIVATLAIEVRRTSERTIVVGLHPGTVATRLSAPFSRNVPAGRLFDPDRAAVQLLDVVDALTVRDSGHLLAWDGATIDP